MKDDEILTHDENTVVEPRKFINDLKVQEQRNALLDSVAKEEESFATGKKTVSAFKTPLSVVAYAAITVVAILVTWWAWQNVFQYSVNR